MKQFTEKITTSKGNQLKFFRDDKWYKADFLGYEGASEFIASHLIKQSNVADYVTYKLEDITINDRVLHGCVSPNFLEADEQLCTAHRLLLAYKGINISETLERLPLEEKIAYFVDAIEDAAGIQNFGKMLTLMLEWDRFILNEDRHFNNIAFIKSGKGFRLAPFFDNGAAFLSDTRDDYPMNKSIYGLMASVEAKPFSKNFDAQADTCISLYGTQLKLSRTLDIGTDNLAKIAAVYGDNVSERIHAIFKQQLYNHKEYLTLPVINYR